MGVDHAERRRLLAQMHEDAREHRVLDDVGEIAGMEGVAIVHAGISPGEAVRLRHGLTGRRRRFDKALPMPLALE